jgi:putative Mn2+ efflux pump MntP
MDAFAVSLTEGARLRRVSAGHILRMGGTFGGFQFAMPLAGWLLGAGAQGYIASYASWLASILLLFVGGNMLKGAWGKEKQGKEVRDDSVSPTQGGALLLLGIATSLDALSVGISLALLRSGVWFPALVVGIVCFFFAACGLLLGAQARRLPLLGGLGGKVDVLGGLILIGIGMQILWRH